MARTHRIRKLLERDGDNCHYCLRPFGVSHWRQITLDHKVPLSKNGTNVISNLLLSCRGCNTLKGAKPYEKFKESKILQIYKTSLGLAPPQMLELISNNDKKKLESVYGE